MKINAGCGLDYRPGYLNVDMFDGTVADRLMPLTNLDLPDGCATEVLARQTLEHLGYFQAKHFLSESFRVLGESGALVIETPELETAFARFGNASPEDRQALTQWIFGLETRGMEHRFCFPRELLETTVAAAGFSLRELTRFETPSGLPALRLTAIKKTAGPADLFMTQFRRICLAEGLCPFDSEPACALREKTLDSFTAALTDFYRAGKPESLVPALERSLESPALTARFFAALEAREIAPPKFYSKIAAGLTDLRFRTELVLRITDLPLVPARQEQALPLARALLRAAIAGLRTGGDISDYLPALPRTETAPEYAVMELDENILKNLSRKLNAQGLKLAASADLTGAAAKFRAALKLFRQNPYAWWNMARLARLEGNPESKQYFGNAAESLALNPEWDKTGSTAKGLLFDISGKGIINVDGVFTVKLQEDSPS